jgi:3-dehydroquinate synthetase
MCAPDVRARLIAVLHSLGLPTEFEGDIESALHFTSHDKKREDDFINAVFVDAIGSSNTQKMPLKEWQNYIREQIGG